MLLIDSNLSSKDTYKMLKEMEDIKGVSTVLGYDSLVDPSVPEELIPDKIKNELQSDKWKLAFVFSDYKVASDEVNNQIDDHCTKSVICTHI